MAKKSTNKPWAARLREWEEEASAPLPPSGDWDRLAKRMMPQEKRKNRLPIWVWWLGLGVSSLLLTYWWTSPEPIDAAVPTSPRVLNAKEGPPANLPPQQDAATIAAGKLPEENSQQPSSLPSSAQHTTATSEPLLTNLKQEQPTTAPRQARPIASQPTATLSLVPAVESPQTTPAKNATAIPPLASTPLWLLPEKQQLLQPAVMASNPTMEPAIRPVKQEKWAVGPTLQIAQNSLNSGNTTGLRPISSEQQQGLNSGLALRRTLGNHWGIQLGMSRGQETVSSRYRFQRIYTANDERVTTNGEAINNFSVELDGKYTKTDTDIEVSRPANQPIGSPLRLLIEAQLEERIRTTQVPLLLTYDQALGNRLSLRLGSGISWQRHQIQTEQQARLIQAGRFQVRRSRMVSRTALVNESLWLGQLSVGLDYQLGSRWSVIGQVNAYTQLGNTQSDAGSAVNYQGVGGQLLLLYHF